MYIHEIYHVWLPYNMFGSVFQFQCNWFKFLATLVWLFDNTYVTSERAQNCKTRKFSLDELFDVRINFFSK